MAEPFARVPLAAARFGLGARAYRVLIAIAAHADRDGRAFPSLARIAEITRIDRRGLNAEIAKLVTTGLITVEHRRDNAGDAASNLYTINFSPKVSPHGATPIARSGDTVSPVEATPGVAPGGDVTDQYGTDHRTPARRAARGRVPNHNQDSANKFETFWRVYPSRHPNPNPRKPAQDKFKAALRGGVDAAAIITGAENYAALIAQQGTEPRYIPEAKTWLQQERWKDHQQRPEPPRLRVGML